MREKQVINLHFYPLKAALANIRMPEFCSRNTICWSFNVNEAAWKEIVVHYDMIIGTGIMIEPGINYDFE